MATETVTGRAGGTEVFVDLRDIDPDNPLIVPLDPITDEMRLVSDIRILGQPTANVVREAAELAVKVSLPVSVECTNVQRGRSEKLLIRGDLLDADSDVDDVANCALAAFEQAVKDRRQREWESIQLAKKTPDPSQTFRDVIQELDARRPLVVSWPPDAPPEEPAAVTSAGISSEI